MSTTAVEQRTIVQTTTPGWFIDAADPDGGRVRKSKDGTDRIVTLEQYETAKAVEAIDGNGILAAIDQVLKGAEGGKESEAGPRGAESKIEGPTPTADGQPVVVSDTGKQLVGKTTEIKCLWVDEGARNAKVNKLLEKDPRKVTPEQIEQAAGVKPCGASRVIKVQDGFQVRFCVEHQDEHRKAIRREKMRARRAAKS